MELPCSKIDRSDRVSGGRRGECSHRSSVSARRTERGSSAPLPCSRLEGRGEGLDAGEPLLRVLRERPQHHLLDRRRDRGYFVVQRWRRNGELLIKRLIPLERALATEPLIHHDRERVLIAPCTGLSLLILRGHFPP